MKISKFMVCSLMVSFFLPVTGLLQAATAKNALSAREIVNRNVKARGGLMAWRNVTSMQISGELEAGGKKNTDLPFVLRLKRPHKSRLEITFRNKQAIQVFDGKQGWKVRPFLGRNDVEPFSPKEEKLAQNWEQLDGPLVDYKKKGTEIKLEGMQTVEGHKCYKLLLSLKTGDKRHVWVDARTFLERKIDGQPRKLDGKMRKVSIYYRDYHHQAGLTMPYVFETVVDGGKLPHKIHIKRVQVNPKLNDKLFAKPTLALAAPVTQTASR